MARNKKPTRLRKVTARDVLLSQPAFLRSLALRLVKAHDPLLEDIEQEMGLALLQADKERTAYRTYWARCCVWRARDFLRRERAQDARIQRLRERLEFILRRLAERHGP